MSIAPSGDAAVALIVALPDQGHQRLGTARRAAVALRPTNRGTRSAPSRSGGARQRHARRGGARAVLVRQALRLTVRQETGVPLAVVADGNSTLAEVDDLDAVRPAT